MAGPVSPEEIRRALDERVDRLRALGHVRDAWVPVPLGSAGEDGGYCYRVEDGVYVFAARERGEEHDRRETTSLDDLLFWCVDSVVMVMASEWEVAHRRPEEDSRRRLFARRLELMAALDEAWASRLRAQLGRVLEDNPYDDALVGWSRGTVRAVRRSRRRWRRGGRAAGALELTGNDDRAQEARRLVARLVRGAGVPDRVVVQPVVAGASATYEFELDGRRLVVPEEQLTPELRRLAELVLDRSR